MHARVVEFAGVLRANGLRVSPAEVADAVEAAALVGAGDRATFRAALRTALVKRSRDVPAFDGLFELHFSALGRVLEGRERGVVEELEALGLLEGDDLALVSRTVEELLRGMSPLARAALGGDPALLARLLRGAALQVGLGSHAGPVAAGFRARRLLAAAGGAALEGEAAALERALRERGLGPAALRVVSGSLEAALRDLEEVARRWAELEGRARTLRQDPGAFAPVTREEAARMEVAVRRLAERLRARLVRRERSRRRGALAVRRTLRRNLGLGGLPARLVFRHRRPERPDLVVLCDVSESVRHVTRLMLLFLYTLQSLFTRVRTFVFVSDLAEVTGALRAERDPARAAQLAVAARSVNLAANSNYGRALARFHEGFRGAVTRRTTVLVIGDGRNNYNAPEAWVLEELRRRARRVLWICPEPRSAWGAGDSEMPLYASRCSRVATVGSLEDLEELADVLVPRGGG